MVTVNQLDGDSSTAVPFRLFSAKAKPSKTLNPKIQNLNPNPNPTKTHVTPSANLNPNPHHSFSSLNLSTNTISTLKSLSITRPTPVQQHLIPEILAGKDVLAIAKTGSGKTLAFALPILEKLYKDPYGVYALVVTPSRELAVQLVEQFRAAGAGIGTLRCSLVVGGLKIIDQAKDVIGRPHVVVATPGRVSQLMIDDRDFAEAFSRTKILVLDEADRIVDTEFQESLSVIFKCLPKGRQTLLFSATKTSTLERLHKISQNSTYFYEEYEGMSTVDSLKQQYIFMPNQMKEIYLHHVLSRMEDDDIRSAIVFVAMKETCHFLKLLFEELDLKVVALSSQNSQTERFSALNKFKSGAIPILIATDLASRGLDIPTVDLVINYDIPRDPRSYVHRVGRTARAGRGGFSVSFITQNDIDLIHAIEAKIEKTLDAYEHDEKEVHENITKVFKARRIVKMKMIDDGYEEKAEARRKLKKRSRKEDTK